ncbi:MAG: SOS response-associated peptidase [Pseudomonadota bacterium]
MCGRFASALIAGHADSVEWLRIERDAPPPDWVDSWQPAGGPGRDAKLDAGSDHRPGSGRSPGIASGVISGLDAAPVGDWPPPSWNVAPTQRIAIVVAAGASGEARRVLSARWGLVPRWWRKPLADLKASTFNARAEEAAAKPMFRDAWKFGRCLVPAAGYYEWTGKAGAKTPWFIAKRTNRPGFCFAGLWAEAVVDGERLVSATILTTAAGPATRQLHPRSPVVLDEAAFETWLTGPSPADAALMLPIPDALTAVHEVDRAVGQVRNDGPHLVMPAGLGL